MKSHLSIQREGTVKEEGRKDKDKDEEEREIKNENAKGIFRRHRLLGIQIYRQHLILFSSSSLFFPPLSYLFLSLLAINSPHPYPLIYSHLLRGIYIPFQHSGQQHNIDVC